MIITNLHFLALDPNNQIASTALIIAALFVFFLLVVLIESVVLQLLGWGSLKPSLRSSFFMNLASAPFISISLALVPRLGFSGLLVSFGLAILFESLILARLKKVSTRESWWIAILANLASYLILVIPTYLQSR